MRSAEGTSVDVLLSTTHDWSVGVDREHLDAIRRDPDRYAPGGVVHLILEVLVHAADEARVLGAGRCPVVPDVGAPPDPDGQRAWDLLQSRPHPVITPRDQRARPGPAPGAGAATRRSRPDGRAGPLG